MIYEVALEGTTRWGFATNDTGGSAADASSGPTGYAHQSGAIVNAAPITAGITVDLLSEGTWPAGCYQISIAATAANGYAAGNDYQVFVSATVDSETPAAYIGTLRVVAAGDTLYAAAARVMDVTDADSVLLDTTQKGAVADAVWDEALGDHNAEDTVGNVLNDLTTESGGGVYQLATDAVPNVTGAVGSVAGAVGSVTGAVGSVTGDVGGLAAAAQQDIADALKLAPTAGDPATGSVNKDLDALTTGVNVTTIESVDATTQLESAVDAGLDNAIPVSPTANSVNERVKAIDDLTQASGSGDLAALWTRLQAVTDADSVILDAAQRTAIGDALAAINLASGTVDYEAIADSSATVGALLAACRMILAGKMTAPSSTSKAYMEVDGATTGLTVTHAADYTTRDAPT